MISEGSRHGVVVCSYRTYEEWKLAIAIKSIYKRLGSYRTYEEWKQGIRRIMLIVPFNVLTVPMRNGNR